MGVVVDVAVIVVACGVGLAFPRWWLVVPSFVLMALGLFDVIPGSIGFWWAPLALGLGIAARQAASRERREKPPIAPTPQVVAGLALSIALITAEVYVIENTSRVNSGFWGWISLALLLIAFVGGGLIVAQWWAALLLPLLAVLIAWPAGENPAMQGDIPWVVFTFVFFFPVWALLVALGVGIRRWIGGRAARKPLRTA